MRKKKVGRKEVKLLQRAPVNTHPENICFGFYSSFTVFCPGQKSLTHSETHSHTHVLCLLCCKIINTFRKKNKTNIDYYFFFLKGLLFFNPAPLERLHGWRRSLASCVKYNCDLKKKEIFILRVKSLVTLLLCLKMWNRFLFSHKAVFRGDSVDLWRPAVEMEYGEGKKNYKTVRIDFEMLIINLKIIPGVIILWENNSWVSQQDVAL